MAIETGGRREAQSTPPKRNGQSMTEWAALRLLLGLYRCARQGILWYLKRRVLDRISLRCAEEVSPPNIQVS